MNLITNEIETAGSEYIAAGYTVAVLYYRLPLSPLKNDLVCSDPQEPLSDLGHSIKLLIENAVEYHVDITNIVLAGFDSGAHLAALYTSRCEKRGSCPTAQVLHFPLLEIGAKIFCTHVGSDFTIQQDYDACFPTALVDAATPPTVIYHHEDDPVVSTMEISNFVTSLMNEGVSYEYYSVPRLTGYEVPTGGHHLVPFHQVAAVSDGRLDGTTGDYSSLIERAINLPPPACVRCTDIGSQYMSDNGITCSEMGEGRLQSKCSLEKYWFTSGFCRYSCYMAGKGYPGDVCCSKEDEQVVEESMEVASVEASSMCSQCTDLLTPWMTANHETCKTSLENFSSRCRGNPKWRRNSYCQNSCYHAGLGYDDGVECCLTE